MRAAGHRFLIEAIGDGAPTVRMTIAIHHPRHAELYITSIFNQLLHAERPFAFVLAGANPPISRNAINKNKRTVGDAPLLLQ